ncbi:MAG: Nitrous oxide reductase maturation transmembrane protein NosY [Cytophagales bacterium]|jgi:Cu-processing system permease protein|nr:ABC transporter permease subunit [Bacteroidota bacterium]MBS1980427.1 ABC transporter permease subunit [Bacteroidota bacterium]WHZ07742.1 MAG: Nitrous oxide reductase maturation transmembrane protein NosY [Cytophagales bacterium]
MIQILKYVLRDVLRARFVLFYTLFLLLSTSLLLQLDSDPDKAVMSLLNIVLLVVPLVSIIFTTIHYFNSYEFILLLMAQPIDRRSVFLSQYLGVALSLCAAFAVGVGVPALLFGVASKMGLMILVGMASTIVFVSLAFLSTSFTRDKAKGIGIALLFWFYFSLIYDGILLWVVYSFSDYPMETATLVLSSLNPIDLARITMLLSLDASALMGYTGAFFKNFFGSGLGISFTAAMMLMWMFWPVQVSLRRFKKNDL